MRDSVVGSQSRRRVASSWLGGAVLCVWLGASPAAAEIFHAQGELCGEVTMTSAILQTRLTATPDQTEGRVPGAAGVARFEYADNPQFQSSQFTAWAEATADSDFIIRAVVRDLRPGTQYHYRLHYGMAENQSRQGEICRFRTLEGAEGLRPASFVVVTGMNYERFHGVKREQDGPRPDRAAGYPALETMRSQQLDFFVGTGDNVYYDGQRIRATTQEALRRKWHEQFVQPRFVQLFREVPTYWEKDDHDHRYNDCDRQGNRPPSSELGIATFREQLPVVAEEGSPTYRTHRINRDLQIWLVEGRDYRSPNRMPDGPDKTLWGAQQLAWLKRTLLESDATFKLLISPTPLVGPDDAYKTDNHTNHQGFRTEGRAFFRWVVEHQLHQRGFYTVCGDRHWQYHSRDPLGVEEFSCGALVDENSRLGRKPGDPKSTDPEAEIHQFYTQARPSGGFLKITVGPGTEPAMGQAVFTFMDEHGKILYETRKERRHLADP